MLKGGKRVGGSYLSQKIQLKGTLHLTMQCCLQTIKYKKVIYMNTTDILRIDCCLQPLSLPLRKCFPPLFVEFFPSVGLILGV